jgi:hypothetical protein
MIRGTALFILLGACLSSCGVSPPKGQNLKKRNLSSLPAADSGQEQEAPFKDSDPSDPWVQGVRRTFSKYPRPRLHARALGLSARFRLEGSIGRAVASKLRNDVEMLAFLGEFPRGLRELCPGFEQLVFEDKTRVYLSIFDALAFAESGYNDGLTYRERFKNSDGSAVVSTGLLQISERSARGHRGACDGATTQKLKDPVFNVRCGFRIAKNQIKRRQALWFHDNSVYYWSVWSKGRNRSGFLRFAGRLSELVEKRSVWPTQCGLPRGL